MDFGSPFEAFPIAWNLRSQVLAFIHIWGPHVSHGPNSCGSSWQVWLFSQKGGATNQIAHAKVRVNGLQHFPTVAKLLLPATLSPAQVLRLFDGKDSAYSYALPVVDPDPCP